MSLDAAIKVVEGELMQLLSDFPKLSQYVPTDWQTEVRTRFIYEHKHYASLLEALEQHIRQFPQDRDVVVRRWFNYRVSKSCEALLCQYPGIEAHPDECHKTIDVLIDGVPFDVKATRLPRPFGRLSDPRTVLNWFYTNQSQGHRQGYNNRLIIAVDGTWEDKSNLGRLADAIAIFQSNREAALIRTLNLNYNGLTGGLIVA